MRRGLALFGLCSALALGAQGLPATLGAPAGPVRLVERADFSRYDDGRYTGLVWRETRGVLEASPAPGGATDYRGDFYVLEETRRNEALAARALDRVVEGAWRVAADGRVSMLEDSGYPSLRGVPALPAKPVALGERWIVEGSRAVDPLGSGAFTRLPILVEYAYAGRRSAAAGEVDVLSGKFATRYRKGQDPRGDSSLERAEGTHDFEVLIDVASGRPQLLRDRFDETFFYSGGRSVRFKGFFLLFYEGIVPLDRVALASDLDRTLGGSGDLSGGALPGGSGAAAPSAGGVPLGPGTVPPGSGAVPSGSGGATPGSGGALASPGAGSSGSGSASSSSESAAPGSGAPGVAEYPEAGLDLRESEEGLVLSIRDLRFAPDSAELLPSERGRLDLVAQALKSVPGRSFLVGGHTASVGRPADEAALSEARAKRVVDELVARGIEARRFLWQGYGATRPLAPNDSEANKALNRRVEITILED